MGKAGMLQSMELERVGHDVVVKQQREQLLLISLEVLQFKKMWIFKQRQLQTKKRDLCCLLSSPQLPSSGTVECNNRDENLSGSAYLPSLMERACKAEFGVGF